MPPKPAHIILKDKIVALSRDPIWQMIGVIIAVVALGWAVYASYAGSDNYSQATPTPTMTTVAYMSTTTYTPAPTDTLLLPTNVPPATVSPAAIFAPEFVESFETYEKSEDLLNHFWINSAEKSNEGSLYLEVGGSHASDGQKAIAFYFNIRNPKPELNYSGFERNFPPRDLTDYSRLCVWVENDPQNGDLDFIVQFGEVNPNGEPPNHIWKKEVWKYKTSLPHEYKNDLCMSLTNSFFERASWSVNENDKIDLEAIDYYGIFVESKQGRGVIYLDNLRLE